MKNFEEQLAQMSKPEISNLKHQDMLANAITNAKDKSVLSWWWISIPLYIIAALLMKTLFMHHTTVITGIHELTSKSKYISLLLFLVLPAIITILNFTSIRRIYYLLGSPKTFKFIQVVWFNILMIILSVLVLIVYSL